LTRRTSRTLGRAEAAVAREQGGTIAVRLTCGSTKSSVPSGQPDAHGGCCARRGARDGLTRRTRHAAVLEETAVLEEATVEAARLLSEEATVEAAACLFEETTFEARLLSEATVEGG
jgi:cell division septum initiation protein DivIVA